VVATNKMGFLLLLQMLCAMKVSISRRPALRAWKRALVSVWFFCAIPSFVLGQAEPSPNPSKPFGPESCGRADPGYIHTANETGGMPMFLQRSEAAKAFQLVRESTRTDVSTVFWATGILEGKPQVYAIPVDSMTKRITFTFSGDTKGSQLKLSQPSGGLVTQGGANIEATELNCGRIVTVSSPETGEWEAEINGSGRYWVEAQAQSDIHFIGIEFVKKGGRPGHEGLFRIQGQPVFDTPATLQASLSAGAGRTAEFWLVSEQGQKIQKLEMYPVNSDREFLELVGSVDLPDVPFRVAVIGHDSRGKRYQRFFPSLFHAESVEITPTLDFDELPTGSTKQTAFTLRNIGAPRTFKITVTDARRFVTKVEPNELVLGTGQSGIVRVDLAIPSETSPGIGDDVVFVARSTEGPFTSNSSVVHFSVRHNF
jgi:von Willebrand factor A domain-containing protein 7